MLLNRNNINNNNNSLLAFPGTYDLVLKNRFGFIKVAIENGASIVPVISFGENGIYIYN